jgi:hypothetical protein
MAERINGDAVTANTTAMPILLNAGSFNFATDLRQQLVSRLVSMCREVHEVGLEFEGFTFGGNTDIDSRAMTTDKITNGPILFAIVSTLIWGGIDFACLSWPFALGLFVIHPLIGWGWCLAVEGLCDGIDKAYELDGDKKWGDWFADSRLIFAAWWPVSGPIGLVITFVGLMYGLIFRALFTL